MFLPDISLPNTLDSFSEGVGFACASRTQNQHFQKNWLNQWLPDISLNGLLATVLRAIAIG